MFVGSVGQPASQDGEDAAHAAPTLRQEEAVCLPRANRPAVLDAVLLVVRRDHAATERITRIGRIAGIRTLVDRRRGDRRRRDSVRVPIQTRRTERRRQRWVDEALETVGAAFARLESPTTAEALQVTTELIGDRWYGVLYRHGTAPLTLTVAEIANRLWVSPPCDAETTARDLAMRELSVRGSLIG